MAILLPNLKIRKIPVVPGDGFYIKAPTPQIFYTNGSYTLSGSEFLAWGSFVDYNLTTNLASLRTPLDLYQLSARPSSLNGGINVSNCPDLVYLICNNNSISSLNVTNDVSLSSIKCHNNQLSSLDISTCSSLTYLSCSSNNLSSLNVSNCPDLTYFDCNNNKISALDVSNCPDLVYLICNNNSISSLSVLTCSALTYFNCGSNKLSSLDVSNCTQLDYLSANNNYLSQQYVDNILQSLVDNSLSGYNLNLTNNTTPSVTGLDLVLELSGWGWNVQVDP